MNQQQKLAVRAVLEAALHNVKMAKDQVTSLKNPDDDSFPDFEIAGVATNLQKVINAINSELRGL
jgi:hypothetical protein